MNDDLTSIKRMALEDINIINQCILDHVYDGVFWCTDSCVICYCRYGKISPLLYSLYSTRFEISRWLLFQGAKIYTEDNIEIGQDSILSFILNTHCWDIMDIVRFLVEYGVDINATDNKGNTPLMFATRENNVELVKLLLRNNADPFIKNMNGSTALNLSWNGTITKLIEEHCRMLKKNNT